VKSKAMLKCKAMLNRKACVQSAHQSS